MILAIALSLIIGFQWGETKTKKEAAENLYICRVVKDTKKCYDLNEDVNARNDKMGSQFLREFGL